MTPTVLPIRWPNGESRHGKSNIETIARTCRFRLLGRACQQRGIGSLLFAHHEDDSAETVMMRLISGASMAGLAPLKLAAHISECHGMYGVSNSTLVSSDPDESQSCGSVQGREGSAVLSAERHDSITISLPIVSGGIRVYRPLLPFPKARLQATCQNLGIEWVEDETNADPAYTKRNAVRILLRSDRLPPALRVPSLLACAKKAEELQKKCLDWSRRVWNECKILNFDTRAGTLVFQLPSQKLFNNPQSIMSLDRAKATYLIRKILSLVSPLANVNSAKLDKSVSSVFPHMSDKCFGERAKYSSQPERKLSLSGVSTFTVVGVQVTNSKPSEFPPTYIIQRMPFHRSRYPKPIPINPGQGYQEGTDTAYQMRLWDHRFWLSVKNLTSQVLYIAPLTPSRVKSFHISLRSDPNHSSTESARFERMMEGLVHPSVRWTLPAIIRPIDATSTYREASDTNEEHEDSAPLMRSNDHASKRAADALLEHLVPDRESWTTLPEVEALGEVIALPSLGFVSHSWKDKVFWDCRFKKVDLGLREVKVLESSLGSATL